MPTAELLGRLHQRGSGELDKFAEQPIWIDDETCDLEQIKSLVRQSVRRNKTRLVLIDYLDYVDVADRRLKDQDKIRVVTLGLKRLAKSLKITIVLLCQLNRGVENREDKRPRMADLRMSGGIEQDGDVVILIHRPSYYDKADQPGIAELIVCKQRGGRRGDIVKVRFIDERTEFIDYVGEDGDYTFGI